MKTYLIVEEHYELVIQDDDDTTFHSVVIFITWFDPCEHTEIPALSLTGYATLGKLFNPFLFQFPIPKVEMI